MNRKHTKSDLSAAPAKSGPLSRSVTLNLPAPEAYKAMCDVLLLEKVRIEKHNPPKDGSFYIYPKAAFANFGLRMAYPGEFTLNSLSDAETRLLITVKPRLRLRRNLHALIPVAVATAAFGVWGLGASVAVVGAAVCAVMFVNPSKRLNGLARHLKAAVDTCTGGIRGRFSGCDFADRTGPANDRRQPKAGRDKAQEKRRRPSHGP